jgi:hypothetical protein
MKKQIWLFPWEIDLLISALEVAMPSTNRANYGGDVHGEYARYKAGQFTIRRIQDLIKNIEEKKK